MIWLVVSLLAAVALVVICVICSSRSSDPTCPWTGTLPPSMTGLAVPSPEPVSMSPESMPPTPPSLGVEVLLYRIRALENMNRQKDLAIRTMSDVRHVPMLAQFNELDGEYNRLFERHAKVQQELFDAQSAIRILSRMAQKL